MGNKNILVAQDSHFGQQKLNFCRPLFVPRTLGDTRRVGFGFVAQSMGDVSDTLGHDYF